MQIQIRKFIDPDTDFIYSSWLNSYKNDSSFARKIARSIFFKWHQKIVKIILSRPSTTISIACFDEMPEVILGYMIHEKQKEDEDEKDIIHFVYVKKDYRKQGIAKLLIESQSIHLNESLFTHFTDTLYDLKIKEKHPKFMYDPYRI